MDSKVLLAGISGFLLGGFIVSLVAMNEAEIASPAAHSDSTLSSKSGDAFDRAFIAEMITHHEGAIDMAKLAESRAKHNEIKELSQNIITTQSNEIKMLKMWQKEWKYTTEDHTNKRRH